MKYRYMGISGTLVSRITLGSMTFGAKGWGAEEKDAHAIIRAFIEAGGNSIDTADIYAGGRSEEILGSLLPQLKRDELVIASKCYFPDGDKPNAQGLSRKHILTTVDRSLRRLKTDYIDLWYIHGPDPVTPLEETMAALDLLVKQGKILNLGCSNIYAWQMARGVELARHAGGASFVAGQYLYNLVHRDAEREVLPAARALGVGLFPWSPLGGGLLSGKYDTAVGAKPPAGSRHDARTAVDGPRFWHARGFETTSKLGEVARKAGLPMARLAIAWPLSRSGVTSVVIGVRTMEQLVDNLIPGDWDLPTDVEAELNRVTEPERDYLWWFNDTNYKRFRAAADPAAPIPGL